MRVINYRILGYISKFNTKTQQTEQVETLAKVSIPYSEENLEKAKSAAYNGEVSVEDVDEEGGDT